MLPLQGCVCVFSVLCGSLRPPGPFLCPWNFPGKHTGVGCHFLLQGWRNWVQSLVRSHMPCHSESRSVVSDPLWPHGVWSTRFFCPWNSSGKNTGMGCHSRLHRIFPAQGSCIAVGFFFYQLNWRARNQTKTKKKVYIFKNVLFDGLWHRHIYKPVVVSLSHV